MIIIAFFHNYYLISVDHWSVSYIYLLFYALLVKRDIPHYIYYSVYCSILQEFGEGNFFFKFCGLFCSCVAYKNKCYSGIARFLLSLFDVFTIINPKRETKTPKLLYVIYCLVLSDLQFIGNELTRYFYTYFKLPRERT